MPEFTGSPQSRRKGYKNKKSEKPQQASTNEYNFTKYSRVNRSCTFCHFQLLKHLKQQPHPVQQPQHTHLRAQWSNSSYICSSTSSWDHVQLWCGSPGTEKDGESSSVSDRGQKVRHNTLPPLEWTQLEELPQYTHWFWRLQSRICMREVSHIFFVAVWEIRELRSWVAQLWRWWAHTYAAVLCGGRGFESRPVANLPVCLPCFFTPFPATLHCK